LQWKENGHSLTQTSKDNQKIAVYATEFLIDGQSLSVIFSDGNQNVQILIYDPQNVDSRGGQFMVAKGDFHVGAFITKFLRTTMKTHRSTNLVKNALWFATLDGGIGYFAPIDESVFRRFAMLQNRLLTAIPHIAGLNPQAFRMRTHDRMNRSRKNTVLDGNLLQRFLSLDESVQHALAAQLGTDDKKIKKGLIGLHHSVLDPFW